MLKICCRIVLNIAINMVVALQPEFHSKQMIDEFVDEANNRIDIEYAIILPVMVTNTLSNFIT